MPASNGPPFWPVLAGYRNIGGRSAASQAGARAASSSPKTSVCRSTSASVVAGDISAMLWNGVSRMPAVEGVEVQQLLEGEVPGGVGLRAGPGRRAA